jgi:biopolymer transport protein ExbD
MSMSVGQESAGGEMCDINTTPLIDVMLVLLTMLIITLPVMTHAVKLDMPRPNENPPPLVPPEIIDITIDFDGTVMEQLASDGSQYPGQLFPSGAGQRSAARSAYAP